MVLGVEESASTSALLKVSVPTVTDFKPESASNVKELTAVLEPDGK